MDRNKNTKQADSVLHSDMMQILIITIVILVLCIIVPVALSLALKINFSATIDAVNAREINITEGDTSIQVVDLMLEGGLPGALTEQYTKTVSTNYKAVLVPSKLQEHKGAFIGIGLLYGPILMTGSPLMLQAVPETGHEYLVTSASIRLSSIAAPVVFFILFIAVMLFMDIVMAKPNASLRFIATMTVIWLIYSVIVWTLGGLAMRQVNDVLNQMLSEEQGNAVFSLGGVNIIGASMRIFFVGAVIWFASFLLRRSVTEKAENEFNTAI